jgi:hypothetical protein
LKDAVKREILFCSSIERKRHVVVVGQLQQIAVPKYLLNRALPFGARVAAALKMKNKTRRKEMLLFLRLPSPKKGLFFLFDKGDVERQ